MAGLHATIGILPRCNARHETGRGQHVEVNLLSSALSGLVNQTSAYVAGGVVPVPDGQQPPEPVPLRAAALRRRRPDHHRRQQRPVPQAGRGARRPRARRRPAVRPQRGPHRQPRRAAAAAGRAAAHPHRRWSGSATSSPRACRAGRSTPSTAASRSPRRSASTRWCTSARATAAVPSVRNPITFSETPPDYRLPPPALDEHGDEIRRWLATPATAARQPDRPTGQERSVTTRTTSLPHLARHLDRRRDPAARPGPDRRPDGQGRLRRAGVLAGRAAAARPRRRPGSSRRCWSRWPTTASPRPRSPPG